MGHIPSDAAVVSIWLGSDAGFSAPFASGAAGAQNFQA